METNNNKEFIFKKCQAYKEDFPEIQKDLNIFLNFKGILKYPIESPIDQKIDNFSSSKMEEATDQIQPNHFVEGIMDLEKRVKNLENHNS